MAAIAPGLSNMATVYLAHDLRRSHKVALELFGAERFERETRRAARATPI